MQEMCRNTRIKLFILVIVNLITVALDQLTKLICVNHLELGESYEFLPGFLHFTYIRNEGAAFGSLSNARWVFMIASVIMIVAICAYIFIDKKLSFLSVTVLSVICGGGVGNMIDRIAYGYVIDFIDFKFLPFWSYIFNVADSFVCVGAFLLVIIFIAEEYKNKRKNNDVTTDL